jgi:C-terminal processing protease CtpA/Prc
MDLNAEAERAYMFEHAWRQTLKKFLDVKMHGVDWQAVKAAYARFLPYIDNDRDFAELISEMQGELNASHTGGRYRPLKQEGDATAALGFFQDPTYTGDGVAVLEVIEGGPLQKQGTRIKAGVVIEAIDGTKIRPARTGTRCSTARPTRRCGCPVRRRAARAGRRASSRSPGGAFATPVPALGALPSRRG